MKTNKLLSLTFFTVFILQLYAIVTENEQLRIITKPLITLVLFMGMVILKQNFGRFRRRIMIGLIFALIGDVLLMLDGEEPLYFIFGLVAFLICHLFYISAFNLDMQSAPNRKNKYFVISSIILALFCGGFFMYLRPYLGELQIPVLFYCFVITIMVMLSVGRWGKIENSGARMITIGALFFLMSDGFLAYNKFVVPIENSGVIIMSTYMLAQYFIVMGTMNRVLVKDDLLTDASF